MVVAPFNRVKILSRASNFASKPEYQKIFPCILSRASAADTDPEVRVQHGVAPSTLERKYTRTLKFLRALSRSLIRRLRIFPYAAVNLRFLTLTRVQETTRNYLLRTRMALYIIDSSASGKPGRPSCLHTACLIHTEGSPHCHYHPH